jgi:hypothetical protein
VPDEESDTGENVVPEARLVATEHGRVPEGQGWFILNAREAQWWERNGRGVLCEFEGAGFEGAGDFEQLGINLTILGPGEPMAMYHRENDQETSSCWPGRRWRSSRARSARYDSGTSSTARTEPTM